MQNAQPFSWYRAATLGPLHYRIHLMHLEFNLVKIWCLAGAGDFWRRRNMAGRHHKWLALSSLKAHLPNRSTFAQDGLLLAGFAGVCLRDQTEAFLG